MLYAIIWSDVENSLALRKKVRASHMQRVSQLVAEGRLISGGPFPALDAEDPGPAGFTGSLVIAEFPSLEAAQKWIEEDPYMSAGVIDDLTVKPYVQVVP